MEFNWTKDEREYLRRNCLFEGGRMFVCRHQRYFFWSVIYNGKNTNPYSLEQPMEEWPTKMKEAKDIAEKEYLKQITNA